MADLWVPFVAAFIAAAAVLLVRGVILSLRHRRVRTRRIDPVVQRAIIPAKPPVVEPVRMPRVEITPGRSVDQARPYTPIIIGSPTTVPQSVLVPVIATLSASAVSSPVELPVAASSEGSAPSGSSTNEKAATDIVQSRTPELRTSDVSTRIAQTRETPVEAEDDQARRLRIAVGPGRPTTTVGAEAKVWSQWTQDVKTPEPATAQATTPVAGTGGADEDCPHCSGARYRGARFCGRCGRKVQGAVTAS